MRTSIKSIKNILTATTVVAGLSTIASAAILPSQVQNDILLGTYRGGGAQGGAPFQALQSGQIAIKYENYDVGKQYTATSGVFGRAANPALSNSAAITAIDAVPQTTVANSNFQPGEDAWGIFSISEIILTSTGARLWSAAVAPYEITGMFWGEQDTYLNIANPTTQDIHGVNFKIAFWADDTPDFNATPGPGARTGASAYPTVSDGILLWTLNGFPGSADANFPLDEFLTTFNPAAGPGAPNVGNGKVDVDFGRNDAGLGPINGMFTVNTGSDASIKFTGTSPVPGGSFDKWLVNSHDPLVANVAAVPEPSLAVGAVLFAGLVGLRRRRHSMQQA